MAAEIKAEERIAKLAACFSSDQTRDVSTAGSYDPPREPSNAVSAPQAAGRPVDAGRPAAPAQLEHRISSRTMRHVVSDGGWTPMSSAVLRIVSLRAWCGR